MGKTVKLNKCAFEKSKIYMEFEDEVEIAQIKIYQWDEGYKFQPSGIWQINNVYSIEPMTEEGRYVIDIDELIKLVGTHLWENALFKIEAVDSENIEYSILINKSSLGKEEYDSYSLQFVPFGSSLGLEVKRNPQKLECASIRKEEENILFELKDSNILSMGAYLEIHLRYTISSSLYEIKAKVSVCENGRKIAVPTNVFNENRIEYTFDFYVLDYSNSKAEMYNLTLDTETIINLDDSLEVLKFYNNKKNELSCYVRRTVSDLTVRDIKLVDDGLIIPEIDNYVFIEEESVFSIVEGRKLTWDYFNGNKSLYTISNGKIEHLVIDKIIEFSNVNGRFCRTVHGNKKGIYVKQEVKPILLALWGSCYTRNAFNKEINPQWRQLFEIADEYFRMSVLSATSSSVSCISEKDFGIDFYDRNYSNVIRELEKNAFNRLKESNSDYIVLDFYSDALHGARMFEDGTFVGDELAFSPNSALISVYREIIQKKAKVYDNNTEGFLQMWKEHCDMFIERIVSLGYEKKCILVQGYFATTFWNEEGTALVEMSGKKINERLVHKGYLAGKLQIWNTMNNYFMSKLPSTRLIDMSRYNYFGDLKHSTPGPHHFEPNYYRAFIGELCQAILLNLQRE